MPSYTPSPLDHLFHELFGYYPEKAGRAFEMLVAAVFKIVFPDLEITHDENIRGKYCGTIYQIDVVSNTIDLSKRTFIETKDYTLSKRKVSRAELQELQGAILMLDNDDAVFVSATDFTKPALSYSLATKEYERAKPIDICLLRPSITEDNKDRINVIEMSISIVNPDFNNGTYIPILASKELQAKLVGKKVLLDIFYTENGTPIETISNWILKPANNFDCLSLPDDEPAKGEWKFPSGYHIKVDELFIEITSLKYSIPIKKSEEQPFRIESKGEPKLLIRMKSMGIDKLITDDDLKRISFKENGLVHYRRKL